MNELEINDLVVTSRNDGKVMRRIKVGEANKKN